MLTVLFACWECLVTCACPVLCCVRLAMGYVGGFLCLRVQIYLVFLILMASCFGPSYHHLVILKKLKNY